MPTTQGFEKSFYRGIESCVLSDMTDADLATFTRTTVLGIRALNGQTTTPMAGADTGAAPGTRARTPHTANGANPTANGATQRGTRRRAVAGEQTIADAAWDYILGQKRAAKRSEIVTHLVAKGYKEGSIGSALSELKKSGRAANEKGMWQAIRANGAAPQASQTGISPVAEQREPVHQAA